MPNYTLEELLAAAEKFLGTTAKKSTSTALLDEDAVNELFESLRENILAVLSLRQDAIFHVVRLVVRNLLALTDRYVSILNRFLEVTPSIRKETTQISSTAKLSAARVGLSNLAVQGGSAASASFSQYASNISSFVSTFISPNVVEASVVVPSREEAKNILSLGLTSIRSVNHVDTMTALGNLLNLVNDFIAYDLSGDLRSKTISRVDDNIQEYIADLGVATDQEAIATARSMMLDLLGGIDVLSSVLKSVDPLSPRLVGDTSNTLRLRAAVGGIPAAVTGSTTGPYIIDTSSVTMDLTINGQSVDFTGVGSTKARIISRKIGDFDIREDIVSPAEVEVTGFNSSTFDIGPVPPNDGGSAVFPSLTTIYATSGDEILIPAYLPASSSPGFGSTPFGTGAFGSVPSSVPVLDSTDLRRVSILSGDLIEYQGAYYPIQSFEWNWANSFWKVKLDADYGLTGSHTGGYSIYPRMDLSVYVDGAPQSFTVTPADPTAITITEVLNALSGLSGATASSDGGKLKITHDTSSGERSLSIGLSGVRIAPSVAALGFTAANNASISFAANNKIIIDLNGTPTEITLTARTQPTDPLISAATIVSDIVAGAPAGFTAVYDGVNWPDRVIIEATSVGASETLTIIDSSAIAVLGFVDGDSASGSDVAVVDISDRINDAFPPGDTVVASSSNGALRLVAEDSSTASYITISGHASLLSILGLSAATVYGRTEYLELYDINTSNAVEFSVETLAGDRLDVLSISPYPTILEVDGSVVRLNQSFENTVSGEQFTLWSLYLIAYDSLISDLDTYALTYPSFIDSAVGVNQLRDAITPLLTSRVPTVTEVSAAETEIIDTRDKLIILRGYLSGYVVPEFSPMVSAVNGMSEASMFRWLGILRSGDITAFLDSALHETTFGGKVERSMIDFNGAF